MAVNSGDPADTIQKYLQDNQFTFKVMMDSREQDSTAVRYGVQAFPTNYLLDGEGKVVWRSVGFSPDSEKALRAALAQLGVK